MNFGLPEIILIIFVIIAITVIARIVRTRGSSSESNRVSNGATTTPTTDNSGKLRSLFNRMGIALIIGGIVFFLVAAGMFRYAFHSYGIAFIILAIGFIIVFMVRRRR